MAIIVEGFPFICEEKGEMGDNPQHVIKQPKKGVGGWKKGWKEGSKDLGYYEKGCHLSLPPPNISSLRLFCGVARYTEEGWGGRKGRKNDCGGVCYRGAEEEQCWRHIFSAMARGKNSQQYVRKSKIFHFFIWQN